MNPYTVAVLAALARRKIKQYRPADFAELRSVIAERAQVGRVDIPLPDVQTQLSFPLLGNTIPSTAEKS